MEFQECCLDLPWEFIRVSMQDENPCANGQATPEVPDCFLAKERLGTTIARCEIKYTSNEASGCTGRETLSLQDIGEVQL